MRHRIVLGTLSRVLNMLLALLSWLLSRRLTVVGFEEEGRESDGGQGMLGNLGGKWENGRARDGRHVSSGAATPPPPYSHLILIRLCRMYYSVSITVVFLLFEAVPSRQTSTSNLLPRFTSLTWGGGGSVQ